MNKKVDFLLLIIWIIAIITAFLFLNTWFSISKFYAAGSYRMHRPLKQGARTPDTPITFWRNGGEFPNKPESGSIFSFDARMPTFTPTLTQNYKWNRG